MGVDGKYHKEIGYGSVGWIHLAQAGPCEQGNDVLSFRDRRGEEFFFIC